MIGTGVKEKEKHKNTTEQSKSQPWRKLTVGVWGECGGGDISQQRQLPREVEARW